MEHSSTPVLFPTLHSSVPSPSSLLPPSSPFCPSVMSSSPVGTEGGSTVELSVATMKVASLEKKLRERDDRYMAQSQELTELLKKGAVVRTYVHMYI